MFPLQDSTAGQGKPLIVPNLASLHTHALEVVKLMAHSSLAIVTSRHEDHGLSTALARSFIALLCHSYSEGGLGAGLWS